MSCVAWDGTTIAADKQATNMGLRFKATKIRLLASGEVLAWCGDQDSGASISKWYEEGADVTKWPTCQADKDRWCRLIVVSYSSLKVYAREPVAIPCEDAFMAWGSGRDYALGAMMRGATAREAIEVAMRFDNGCGLGIDSFTLSAAGDADK